jgi:NhaA family Na+:H+ antiporter
VPFVGLIVLPAFALLNSGVHVGELIAALRTPLAAGLLLALVVGKPVGVVVGAAVVLSTRLARRPAGLTSTHLVAVGVLMGTGYTMSLFIGHLSVGGTVHVSALRAGVVVASSWSATAGYLLLRRACDPRS